MHLILSFQTLKYHDNRAHVIIQGLVGINQRIKTYAVVKRSEKRTYFGDLVVHFQSESEKSKFLKEYLTKTFHPKGNLFSLKKIYIQEELAVSTDTDCFVTGRGKYFSRNSRHLPL